MIRQFVHEDEFQDEDDEDDYGSGSYGDQDFGGLSQIELEGVKTLKYLEEQRIMMKNIAAEHKSGGIFYDEQMNGDHYNVSPSIHLSRNARTQSSIGSAVDYAFSKKRKKQTNPVAQCPVPQCFECFWDRASLNHHLKKDHPTQNSNTSPIKKSESSDEEDAEEWFTRSSHKQKPKDTSRPSSREEPRKLNDFGEEQRSIAGNAAALSSGFGGKKKKRKPIDMGEWDKVWYTYYSRLKAFYDANGHCEVPFDKNDMTLYNWIIMQRYRRRSGKLPQERVQLLDELGFEWLRKMDRPN